MCRQGRREKETGIEGDCQEGTGGLVQESRGDDRKNESSQ